MTRILKEPALYARQLYDSYFTPSSSFYVIIIELARQTPRLPEEYIEIVARELRQLIDNA